MPDEDMNSDLMKLLGQTVGPSAPADVPRGQVAGFSGCVVGPAEDEQEDDVEVDDRLLQDMAYRLQAMAQDIATEKPNLYTLLSTEIEQILTEHGDNDPEELARILTEKVIEVLPD